MLWRHVGIQAHILTHVCSMNHQVENMSFLMPIIFQTKKHQNAASFSLLCIFPRNHTARPKNALHVEQLHTITMMETKTGILMDIQQWSHCDWHHFSNTGHQNNLSCRNLPSLRTCRESNPRVHALCLDGTRPCGGASVNAPTCWWGHSLPTWKQSQVSAYTPVRRLLVG